MRPVYTECSTTQGKHLFEMQQSHGQVAGQGLFHMCVICRAGVSHEGYVPADE